MNKLMIIIILKYKCDDDNYQKFIKSDKKIIIFFI